MFQTRARKSRRVPLLLALLLPLGLAPAAAQAGTLEARYQVTVAGLVIGTAQLAGDVSDRAYKARLDAQLTGLAGALTTGRGAVSVSGLFQAGRPLSNGYALSANNSAVSRTIRMAMSAGSISQVAIDPPFEPKDDRVPVLEHHRRNVADPVSALLMPVAGGGDVLATQNCNRTIPVFDGVQRFDITMGGGSLRPVNEPQRGYVGHALVCNVRYAPVAGHRPIPSTEFMVKNRDMAIWLVPVEGTRALVPWRIQVRTQIGQLVIEAQQASGLAIDATASIPAKR